MSSYIKWNNDSERGKNRVDHALYNDMLLDFVAIEIDLPTIIQKSSVTWTFLNVTCLLACLLAVCVLLLFGTCFSIYLRYRAKINK